MVTPLCVTTFRVLIVIGLIGVNAGLSAARNNTQDSTQHVRAALTDLHDSADFPGATIGYALPDGTSGSVSVGLACTETGEAMTGDHRMMAGSAGKTFWAAAALVLVEEGRLDLDAPISTWHADEPWFARLPNAADITVRQLMNHTSGLPRYVMKPEFAAAMRDDSERRWAWPELLEFVFDDAPLFVAGEGWAYADTNFIVLGVIVEDVTGDSYYNLVHDRIIRPRELWDVAPTTSEDVPGLACGYVNVENNLLGLDEPNVIDTGRYVFNPQFEWAGGGFATTPEALARWARMLYGGDVLEQTTREMMFTGVDSPALGPGTQYGLGVMMRDSDSGPVLGHAGYFPGYLTDMAYYADHGIALAIQLNTTEMSSDLNPAVLRRVLDECAAGLIQPE